MLYLTYPLNALLMLALPLILAVGLTRRFKLGWRLFWIGAATFVAAQVVHLPLNLGLTALFQQGVLPHPPTAYLLVFNATVLGLTAGLTESLARYLVYRFWIKSARTWREAVLFGAGHGGIEAMIFGGLAGLAFIQLAALRNLDLTTVIPPAQLPQVQQQLAAYWAAPWYASLLGALERVFALCLHLALAVMVLQVFTRRNLLWLFAAIGWHTLADGVSVFSLQTWGIYVTEGLLALFALASLAILFYLRPRQAEAAPLALPPVPGTPAPPASRIGPDDDFIQRLEDSRYIDE